MRGTKIKMPCTMCGCTVRVILREKEDYTSILCDHDRRLYAERDRVLTSAAKAKSVPLARMKPEVLSAKWRDSRRAALCMAIFGTLMLGAPLGVDYITHHLVKHVFEVPVDMLNAMSERDRVLLESACSYSAVECGTELVILIDEERP